MPTLEVSLTDKWMDFILLHFEPHTMQIQLTSRLAAPNLCLWWPNCPKSHHSASFCLSFSYCFLISLSLICYYPFYCFVPAHIALIRLMWDPCLSCKWFCPCLSSLKVFSLSPRRLLGKAAASKLLFPVLCFVFVGLCNVLHCLHLLITDII